MKKICSILIAVALAGCGGDDGPARSGQGESCTKRADCSDGLACYSGICLAAPSVDAGTDDGGVPINPIPTANLGQRGETCTASTDCAKPLVCVPLTTGTGAVGLGRCDLATYGYTPTGKTCTAECKTEADCCELPLGLTATDSAGTAVAINSCADLAKIFADAPAGCETTATASTTKACLYYKAYCECGAGVWACNSGMCSYTKACSTTGEVAKGCPAQSRSGLGLVTNCNATSSKCESVAAGATCPASCDGKAVEVSATEVCAKDECVCLAETAPLCYRKCNDQLDCAYGFTCDTTKRVCVQDTGCDSDAACARNLKNVTAKCVAKTCVVPCKTDLDCGTSGITATYAWNAQVCSAGVCADIGCTSDAECSKALTGGSIKMFCAAPTATAAKPVYTSAITY